MADSKISALPASTTPLAGTEVLPIVQSSSTVKVSVANLTAGRAVAADGLTVNNGITVNNGGIATSGFYNGVAISGYDALGWGGSSTLVLGGYRAGQWTQIDFYTGGSIRTSINSAGIVTMSAYGAGTATFSAAGVISSVSDETWKIKDGVPTNPDAMLKKLKPGYWYYNNEKKETFGSDRQLGFYAQNVNAAIGPEAAPTPEEGKPWGYYDRSVLAVVVMSLQKALTSIDSLTARIAVLETK